MRQCIRTRKQTLKMLLNDKINKFSCSEQIHFRVEFVRIKTPENGSHVDCEIFIFRRIFRDLALQIFHTES